MYLATIADSTIKRHRSRSEPRSQSPRPTETRKGRAQSPTTPLAPEPVKPRVAQCDEELLGRYRDDRRAEDLVELVRRHSSELYRYLAVCVGDASLAEDLVQDTFLQVHSKCHLYQDGWPARPWLYAVAYHRAVDEMRRARRARSLSIDAPLEYDQPGSLIDLLASKERGPFEDLNDRELQTWVRERVGWLPDRLRNVVVLAYFTGHSYADIASLEKIPLGTVRSRLHTAIARLRKMAESDHLVEKR